MSSPVRPVRGTKRSRGSPVRIRKPVSPPHKKTKTSRTRRNRRASRSNRR